MSQEEVLTLPPETIEEQLPWSVADTETDEKPTKVKKPKQPKAKKRPSDFEIFRTIIQRTSDRRQAYLVKNLGEDSHLLFLCSCDESGFTFGSSELSIAILEITNPELDSIFETYLNKLYGWKPLEDSSKEFSGFISLRDQVSELGKTKGESIDAEVFTNEFGTSWVKRAGNNSTCYFSMAVESIFHVLSVKKYCDLYKGLLVSDNPDHVSYPFKYDSGETFIVATFDTQNATGELGALYPQGFRAILTKGADAIVTKGLGEDFPFPVQSEDVIAFNPDGSVVQLVHRVTGEGWKMLMVRPNAVHFPSGDLSHNFVKKHDL